MKTTIYTLAFLLLAKTVYSCPKQTGIPESDAQCCMRPNPPRWCPDTSVAAVKNQLSKLNSSPEASNFARKEIASNKKSSSSGETSLVPNFGYYNFWWPKFCHWNPKCCIKCFLIHYWWGNYNFWGYHWCIWNKCRKYSLPWFPYFK